MSRSRSFATAEQDQDETPLAASTITSRVPPVLTSPSQKCPTLFQLTGPIETLDQKAKETCQDWVNDSETLLIKAAKKTLIDSFQQDFHSFLFLFQLQLKRIKGGYTAGGNQSVASGSPPPGDECSWVSAEPSVKEADTRIADIEHACIDFMNKMGNNMVKRYQDLSGENEEDAAGATALHSQNLLSRGKIPVCQAYFTTDLGSNYFYLTKRVLWATYEEKKKH